MVTKHDTDEEGGSTPGSTNKVVTPPVVIRMDRESLLATSLGLHDGPQGPVSKVLNVLGRGALVAGAAFGISRLFSSEEELAPDAAAVGAYEPR